MDQVSTDDGILVSISCSRNNSQIASTPNSRRASLIPDHHPPGINDSSIEPSPAVITQPPILQRCERIKLSIHLFSKKKNK